MYSISLSALSLNLKSVMVQDVLNRNLVLIAQPKHVTQLVYLISEREEGSTVHTADIKMDII
jgi:hypothetical protein